MTFPIMAILVKILKNHIKGGFFKIWKFTLVQIFVIFPRNNNLGLKNLKFLRIQPTVIGPVELWTFLNFEKCPWQENFSLMKNK